MATTSVLLSGFGGQGLLFAGKMLAYSGLMENKEVSWLPSYGPEMRGGTASCSVVISDDPVGSPLVLEPDILIAMNRPSFLKYIGTVKPGGIAIIDSTMVEDRPERDDISFYAVPATQLAQDAGLKGLANVILIGKLVKESGCVTPESLQAAVPKCVSAKRQELVGYNMQALEIGQAQ